MTASIFDALKAQPVLPLIAPPSPRAGLDTARALESAGIAAVEVVQRTDAALECLTLIAREIPGLIVGAGTVLSPDQAESCIDAGARFIVSPGLDETIVAATQSRGRDVIAGIMTPTELQHALRLGLEVVKFFPAATAGAVPAVKALAAAFGAIRFIPTGGISAQNLAAWFAVDSVLACAGSWLTPDDAVLRGDFAHITTLAAEALAIATTARGS